MPTRPALAPTPFHLLAKPTGAICNLDCKYCFFLSKELLYPGSRFRMADELLDTYIRQLIESQPGPEVIVGWQGGEPTLMSVEFFERSVEYVRKYQRPGQRTSTSCARYTPGTPVTRSRSIVSFATSSEPISSSSSRSSSARRRRRFPSPMAVGANAAATRVPCTRSKAAR
jgi:hypothetical protein